MTSTELGLLVALIIVIGWCYTTTTEMKRQANEKNKAVANVVNNKVANAVANANANANGNGNANANGNASPEQGAMAEAMEYFQVCRDPDETSKALDCLCDDDSTVSFAENPYGFGDIQSFSEYVTTSAVDDDIIKNHQGYVESQLLVGGFTGRTYSPDSHDSYDPIPWIGLRRPDFVQQCNPTQVPDVDVNLYKSNRQFCFRT